MKVDIFYRKVFKFYEIFYVFYGKVSTFCGKEFNLMGNFVHLIRKSVYFYGKIYIFCKKFCTLCTKVWTFYKKVYTFCWYRIFSTLNLHVGPWKFYKKKNLFFHWVHQGTVETSKLLWFNLIKCQSAQSAISSQSDQNALNQPELTEKQNWSKFHQNENFQVSISNPKLLELFVNFDQIWPKVDFCGD